MNPNPSSIAADIANPITRPRMSSSTISCNKENI